MSFARATYLTRCQLHWSSWTSILGDDVLGIWPRDSDQASPSLLMVKKKRGRQRERSREAERVSERRRERERQTDRQSERQREVN